ALVWRAHILARNCVDAPGAAIEDKRSQRGTKCGHVAKTAAPGDAVTGRASALLNGSFHSDDVTAIKLQRLRDIGLAVAPMKLDLRGGRNRAVRMLGAAIGRGLDDVKALVGGSLGLRVRE